MSGSNGGGGRDDGYQVPRPKPTPGGQGGGGGGVEGEDPCDIVQTAALNSPQPVVVNGLSVGDILVVSIGGTPAKPILEVRTQQGLVAGSLTHRGHIAIIECISNGNQYEAIVVQKSGGMVSVRIQRR
jgi:hypothetical protein